MLSFLAVSLYHGPFDQSSYRFWSFRAVFGAGFLVNQNGSTQNAPLNINKPKCRQNLPAAATLLSRAPWFCGWCSAPSAGRNWSPVAQSPVLQRPARFHRGEGLGRAAQNGSSCFEGTLWLGFEGKARGKPLGRCVGSPKKTHPKEFVAELCAQFTTKLSRNVPRLPREAKLRGKANHHVHSSRQRNPHMALTTV